MPLLHLLEQHQPPPRLVASVLPQESQNLLMRQVTPMGWEVKHSSAKSSARSSSNPAAAMPGKCLASERVWSRAEL